MPRKLRLEFPDACYHVINRGNYRRNLFEPKGAAESFEACLFEACGRFGWRVHAFVIMRNHFHLAVETPEPNLSDGMKWLQGTWAMRFNRFRGETGRPFQGRYQALHVEPGHALAQVAHYIHLNPVRARILTAARLPEFRWNSLWWFRQRKRPECLEAETVLAESGGLADTNAGWRRYVDYLDVLADEDARRRDEKFGRLSRGWMIGTSEFKTELQRKLTRSNAIAERVAVLGGGSEAHRQLREALWEEKLCTVAKQLGIKPTGLPAQKSAPAKVQLAAAMKAATSVSNGWLAERLDMGQPASVSQFVRRFRLAGGSGRTAGHTLLSRVKT